jgi:hypothetical protein
MKIKVVKEPTKLTLDIMCPWILDLHDGGRREQK